MPRNRDRHGRGVRGPIALSNPWTGRPVPIRQRPTRAEFFLECVQSSINRVARTCPECLEGIDIGIEEVPSDQAIWQEMADHDAVPLAAAVDADTGQPARVVIYRRPLEHRAVERAELPALVHRALVEQLAVLTSRPVHDIDPGLEED